MQGQGTDEALDSYVNDVYNHRDLQFSQDLFGPGTPDHTPLRRSRSRSTSRRSRSRSPLRRSRSISTICSASPVRAVSRSLSPTPAPRSPRLSVSPVQSPDPAPPRNRGNIRRGRRARGRAGGRIRNNTPTSPRQPIVVREPLPTVTGNGDRGVRSNRTVTRDIRRTEFKEMLFQETRSANALERIADLLETLVNSWG